MIKPAPPWRELFSGMRDLTPEERNAKRAETMKKMQALGEKTTKAIEGVLLPDQLKRLKGIALQRMAAMGMGVWPSATRASKRISS